MELLPEDPQKRKMTIIALGVVGVLVVGVLAYTQLSGDSAPSDPAQAAGGPVPPSASGEPVPSTGKVGGARTYTPGQ